MTLHAVIPVRNNVEMTLKCLNALARQSAACNVIVVDDGSTDGTAGEVAGKHPQVTVLRGGGNLWWAGAVRTGVQHVLESAGEDDFILTLNNDVLFGEDYLAALVRDSRECGRAIVTSFCRRHDEHSAVINQGMRVNWRRAKYTTSIDALNEALAEAGSQADASNVGDDELNAIGVLRGFDYVFGRATLIPVEVFQRIGNFDAEQFPHYFADSEFSSRARRAGSELVVSLKARVESIETEDTTGIHYQPDSLLSLPEAMRLLTSRRSAYELRTCLRFVRCCCPRQYRLRNQLRFLRLALGVSFGRTRVGRWLSFPVRAAAKLVRKTICRPVRK